MLTLRTTSTDYTKSDSLSRTFRPSTPAEKPILHNTRSARDANGLQHIDFFANIRFQEEFSGFRKTHLATLRVQRFRQGCRSMLSENLAGLTLKRKTGVLLKYTSKNGS